MNEQKEKAYLELIEIVTEYFVELPTQILEQQKNGKKVKINQANLAGKFKDIRKKLLLYATPEILEAFMCICAYEKGIPIDHYRVGKMCNDLITAIRADMGEQTSRVAYATLMFLRTASERTGEEFAAKRSLYTAITKDTQKDAKIIVSSPDWMSSEKVIALLKSSTVDAILGDFKLQEAFIEEFPDVEIMPDETVKADYFHVTYAHMATTEIE
jgi:hypothetical protein